MERMRAGQFVTLRESDAVTLSKEWRDVAKRYEKAVELKKPCVYCYTKLHHAFVDDLASEDPKLRHLPTQPCFRSLF